MPKLEMRIREKLEELGNNKYRYMGVVIYAPCFNTAVKRIIKAIEKG